MRSSVFSIIVIVILLVSCNENEQEKGVEEADVLIESFDKNLSEEEIQKVLDEVTNAFYSGDYMAYNDLIDYRALLMKGVSEKKANPFPTKVMDMMVNNFSSAGEMTQQIIENFQYYDCVKSYVNEDGYPTLAFRAYGDFGLNYHELMLAKVDNEVKIIDIYIALSGENFGSSLTDLMSAFNDSKKNSESIEGDPKLAKQYLASGQYQEAIDEIEKLPKTVRESKVIAILELSALSSLDDQKYYQALKEYREKFPSDISADLISLDYYLLEENFETAIEVLENIQEVYPDDGVLDFSIGDIYYILGDCEYARLSCASAVDKSPNILIAKDYLSSFEWECGDKLNGFVLADELINDGYLTFEENVDYLEANYEDYLSWPEYQIWITQYQ